MYKKRQMIDKHPTFKSIIVSHVSVNGFYITYQMELQFKSFNTIAATVYEHHEEILNFFINRSTNAPAESFNAKIKSFRSSLRGITDMKFFLFRVDKIWG